MSDAGDTRTPTDIFQSLSQGTSPSQDIEHQALEQEVKDYSEFLKAYYTKYRRFTIILQTIQECIEDDNNLDPDLCEKIEAIILTGQVSQTRLGEDCLGECILGVPLNNLSLSYLESDKLCSYLKSKLLSKCANRHYSLSKSVASSNESPIGLTLKDTSLLEYRNKLAIEQGAYMKSQTKVLELLEELMNLRLKVVPELTQGKYQESDLKSRVNSLKAQLAKNKYRIDVFMETRTSLQAYEEIIKDLRDQQQSCSKEIQKLKDLKEKYAEVSCKEYDEILKSYLQYKMSFEKKKTMCELCR
ncbi:unnamed protein product [Ceutorhynchus assimilis]|uniref:Uncharacterized protein n=1 Tax=Ceutorhynchus assimilis TaxID=467358 RepID=A0A9N9QC10_9CUCU|nr:unnamed protein product [Ceutorhynchus assimilis]